MLEDCRPEMGTLVLVAGIVLRRGVRGIAALCCNPEHSLFLTDVHLELRHYNRVFVYSEQKGQREDTSTILEA